MADRVHSTLAKGLLLPCVLMLGGCYGLIINGSKQEFSVYSEFPVNVVITGAKDGATWQLDGSGMVKLPRKQAYTAVIEAEGYDRQVVKINSVRDWGWVWFDGPYIFIDNGAKVLNPKGLKISHEG